MCSAELPSVTPVNDCWRVNFLPSASCGASSKTGLSRVDIIAQDIPCAYQIHVYLRDRIEYQDWNVNTDMIARGGCSQPLMAIPTTLGGREEGNHNISTYDWGFSCLFPSHNFMLISASSASHSSTASSLSDPSPFLHRPPP